MVQAAEKVNVGAMIRILRWMRTGCAIALGCCVLFCAGCASHGTGAADSPVDGWRFQITVKYPTQQRYELFKITTEGQIQYGGGMNAINDITTWETALTPQQAKEFVGMMGASPWVKQAPDRGDDKSEPMMVVKFQRRGSSERNFTLYGSNSEAEKFIAFMKELSKQRYESILQKLPEPTEKPAAPAPSTGTSPATKAPPAEAPATTPPAPKR
ncbi:MAG: hypothetical protein K8R92_09940 [Planctomycetes bacterium]|nr:hypothetical protein [Planctomycetota bacterium]